MTRYTHPDFDGTFPKPRGQFVTIEGQQIGSAFFRTSAPQEIEALGFVEYVEADLAPPTQEQIIEGFRLAIEAHVDAVAGQRQYSGAVSISTYVNSTNLAWKAEAEAFIAWRDEVWVYAFTELAKVQNEERIPPESAEAFIAELPGIVWPA